MVNCLWLQSKINGLDIKGHVALKEGLVLKSVKRGDLIKCATHQKS